MTLTRRPDGGIPLPIRLSAVIRHVRARCDAPFGPGIAVGGQGVVEYGLILSLSAALAVILLVVFGGTLSIVLKAVGDAIDAAS